MKNYRLTNQRSVIFIYVVVALVGAFQLWQLIVRPTFSTLGFNLVVYGLLLLAAAMVVFTLMYSAYRFTTQRWSLTMVIHEDKAELEVNGIRLRPEDIDGIYMDGYFKPTIGIRLHKQKLISPRLCFRFADHEDEAIKSLKFWAQQHGISWHAKPFKRWV